MKIQFSLMFFILLSGESGEELIDFLAGELADYRELTHYVWVRQNVCYLVQGNV